MGSNISSQQSNQLENAVTSVINKQNSSTSTTVKCDSNSMQKMNLGSVNAVGCNIDISQTSNVKLDCLLKSVNNLKADQTSDMVTDLTAATQQMLTQKMKGLNLGQSQIANINASAATFIKNNAQNIINSNINNTISLNASSSKEIDIKSIQCSGGSTIKLTQDGIVNSIAKATVNEGISQFNKYIGQSKASLLDKQTAKQTIAGLSIPSFIMIIVGILFIIIVIPIIIHVVKSSGKTQASTYRGPVPQVD